MNEIEYAILPLVKNSVAKLATICRYLLIACVISALAEPLIIFTLHHPIGILCGIVSDHLLQLTLALLTLPALWSHHALLAARGTRITGMLSLFCCILGGILIVCLCYSVITGGLPLLQHQQDAALYISLLLLICCIFNFHNMAAYRTRAKAALAVFLLALLAASISMGVLPIISLIAKALACATGYCFLLKLEKIAPLIISMPERQ